MTFRSYLRKCEVSGSSAQLARKKGDPVYSVITTQYKFNPQGKDISRVKVHNAELTQTFWIRMSIIEKEWWWDAKDNS